MTPEKVVALAWLGEGRPPDWRLGPVVRAPLSVAGVCGLVDAGPSSSRADAWLFWDSALGAPDPDRVTRLLSVPGDVLHAGLCLGMKGLPSLIHFVQPDWMLNIDPPADRIATSWRLSLRACLIRTDVLKELGCCDPDYETLEGASLDLGYRYIKQGAFVRHVPALLPCPGNPSCAAVLPLADEALFVDRNLGRKWLHWCTWRAILSGSPAAFGLARLAARKRDRREPRRVFLQRERSTFSQWKREDGHNRVAVCIPTLERYPYLRRVLAQLTAQTVRPLEVVVVDQTPADLREVILVDDFPGLPLRVITQNVLGQCTGMNTAISASHGEFLLFIGDDADGIKPTLLESYLRDMSDWRADVVACAVDEVGSPPAPHSQQLVRTADTFPAVMFRRALLRETGLMDYAFDRGSRADQDLGIRCYLSGALMVEDQRIRVLHHRAPRGGLRKHGARAVTRSSSKKRVWQRHLPSVTELYLLKRHFGRLQQREALWLRVASMFTAEGDRQTRLLKPVAAFCQLPHTLWLLLRRNAAAERLLERYPDIPGTDDGPTLQPPK